jgi:hypothetical protein
VTVLAFFAGSAAMADDDIAAMGPATSSDRVRAGMRFMGTLRAEDGRARFLGRTGAGFVARCIRAPVS